MIRAVKNGGIKSSDPKIFFVEIDLVFFEQRDEFFSEIVFSMMRFLLLDIFYDIRHARSTDAEGSVTGLPGKGFSEFFP